MRDLKPGFTRFLQADADRLHFAAHSHHPWPDVSHVAHGQAWADAAELMDDKWEHIFGTVIPRTRGKIARLLNLARDETIIFAPNTHELVVRLFSCFEPPVRILTTDAEFHSFHRQSRRWEEARMAIVERVAAEPFVSFADRFTQAARSGEYDLIYLSHVFFDSGYLVPTVDRVVSSISNQNTFIVIDGYHSFMALPVDLSTIGGRVFFIAGGYKYAMSGEGACFMHCPPGYGERPVNTGWYASFGLLEEGPGDTVPYARDASRFYGATHDPSGIYRMDAVLEWLDFEGVGPEDIRNHVLGLQRLFLEKAERLPGGLTPPSEVGRGNFLTFQSPNARHYYRSLHDQRVITDYRGNRLRIGFGIYQSPDDVERLAGIVNDLATP